jgi:hypothetical protein
MPGTAQARYYCTNWVYVNGSKWGRAKPIGHISIYRGKNRCKKTTDK